MDQIDITFKGNSYSVYLERDLQEIHGVVCGDCIEKQMDRIGRSFLVEYEPEHTLT